jgi:hypothetical protein
MSIYVVNTNIIKEIKEDRVIGKETIKRKNVNYGIYI